MGEKQRILDLLDRAHRAQAWHGPALLETLAGVSPKLAAQRAMKGVHSIWELVEHVASWNEIVAMRLAGSVPVVTNELNFPHGPEDDAGGVEGDTAPARAFARALPS